MFTFKPEFKDVQIVLPKHAVIVTANNITDALGHLIQDEYPHYAHNIMEVNPTTKQPQNAFQIEVPELVKKKDISSTSTSLPIDGNSSNLNEEKQESVLSDSQPLAVEKRKPGRPKKNS